MAKRLKLLLPITRLTPFVWDVMLSAVSRDEELQKRRPQLVCGESDQLRLNQVRFTRCCNQIKTLPFTEHFPAPKVDNTTCLRQRGGVVF